MESLSTFRLTAEWYIQRINEWPLGHFTGHTAEDLGLSKLDWAKCCAWEIQRMRLSVPLLDDPGIRMVSLPDSIYENISAKLLGITLDEMLYLINEENNEKAHDEAKYIDMIEKTMMEFRHYLVFWKYAETEIDRAIHAGYIRSRWQGKIKYVEDMGFLEQNGYHEYPDLTDGCEYEVIFVFDYYKERSGYLINDDSDSAKPYGAELFVPIYCKCPCCGRSTLAYRNNFEFCETCIQMAWSSLTKDVRSMVHPLC